jgi:hypothetical protein
MPTPQLLRSRLTLAIALLLLGALPLACSFSRSSENSSDSSENSSDSSSRSSTSSSPGDEKDNARFERDVEQYALAYLEAGGGPDEGFFAGLGDLARAHGVSDWESDASVWEAIGRALARSPASAAERDAYQLAWTGGDAEKQGAVAKGLAAVR